MSEGSALDGVRLEGSEYALTCEMLKYHRSRLEQEEINNLDYSCPS